MKRDMDLVRDILLAIEEKNDPQEPVELRINGRFQPEVSYHLELLHEEGLIKAADWSTKDGHDWRAIGLTSQGHEVLNSIRDPRSWAATKSSSKGSAVQSMLPIDVKDRARRAEPHWIIKHAVQVMIGVIIVGVFGWIAANYMEVWEYVRCFRTSDPLRDGC